MEGRTGTASPLIEAPPDGVYAAFLDPQAGTTVIVTAANVTPGIAAEAHAVELRPSLGNLARFVTAGGRSRS